MRRIRVFGLLVLLTVLVLLFALPGREISESTWAPPTDPSRAASDAELLAAQGRPAEDAPAPSLRTREAPFARAFGSDRGPVTVQVVGPGGARLPGVTVGVVPSSNDLGRFGHAPPPANGLLAVTDAQGEAVFADLPRDGTASVVAYRDDPQDPDARIVWLLPPGGGHPPYAVIRGERAVLHLDVGRWLRLLVVDAESGTPIRGVPVVVKHPAPRRTRPARQSDEVLLVTRGEAATQLRFDVKTPRGRVAWEATTWWMRVTPYARSLVAYYPLRREVDVSVSVRDKDGAPTVKPVLHFVDVAGRRLPRNAVFADAVGRRRIRGVPFLPGEQVVVQAGRMHGVMHGTARAILPDAPDRDVHLAVVVPPEPDSPIGIGVGSGGAGGAFRGRGGRRSLSAGGGGLPRPRGSVLVKVRRHDGSPAAGALVTLTMDGRTLRADRHGSAWFPLLRPGTYHVDVRQVGLFPLAGQVTVHGHERAVLELRESRGGSVGVEVVDEEGRPLSFATLEVKTPSGQPWIDLDGITQRVDPFTDHEGRRTLGHVEPGTLTITAHWGSRKASVRVAVTEGEAHDARIVLRGPAQD